MFLDQNSRHFGDRHKLLQRVSRMVDFHRGSGISYTLLQVLRYVAPVPLLLRLFLRANRQICTCVFSNVGRVFDKSPLLQNDVRLKTGNLVLESLEFYVPLRAGTDVAFSVLTYADTLKLCMHYKPQRIDRKQAQSLFGAVVASLRESVSQNQPAAEFSETDGLA